MKRLLLISLALICCTLVWADRRALLISANHPATSSFTANTAVFDGTNDKIQITSVAGATNLADAKIFTCSMWLASSNNGTEVNLWSIRTSGGIDRLRIFKTTGNLISVGGWNSAGTKILDITTTSTILVADGWRHLLFVMDQTADANCKIYINGSSDSLTITTRTDDTLDLVPGVNGFYTVGASSGTSFRLNGALAEFWFDDQYNDAVGDYYSGGHPISLGSNGETPTGTAPSFYYSLNGSGDSWIIDSSGSGNDMSIISGSLGSTTSP